MPENKLEKKLVMKIGEEKILKKNQEKKIAQTSYAAFSKKFHLKDGNRFNNVTQRILSKKPYLIGRPQ
jgi:hypothetical protein